MNSFGHFFFRTRNWLFPLVLVAVLVALPPRPLNDKAGAWALAAGLLIIVAGQALRVITIGLDYIKRGGKDGRIWANHLVTGGVYAHCRNPMYTGNIAISLGYFLLSGNWLALLIGGGFFIVAYFAITASEETYLRQKFGADYEAYCRHTPRWLPQVVGLVRTLRSYRFDWPAVIVKEYGTLLTTCALGLGIVAWKAQRASQLERAWPFLAAGMVMAGAFWGVARWLKKGRGLRSRGTTLTQAGIDQRRQRIDAIDAELLRMLNKRAEVVSAIFDLKRAAGIPRYDEARTERILQRLKRLNEGPLTDEQVARVFEPLLKYYAFEHGRAAVEQSSVASSAVPDAPEVTVVTGT